MNPEVFAAATTAVVARVTLLANAISARRTESRHRRAVEDAKALVEFYRTWLELSRSVSVDRGEDPALIFSRSMTEIDGDLAAALARSRRADTDGPVVGRTIFIQRPARGIGARALHVLYYFLLVLATSYVFVAVGSFFEKKDHTVVPIVAGSIFLVVLTIFVRIAAEEWMHARLRSVRRRWGRRSEPLTADLVGLTHCGNGTPPLTSRRSARRQAELHGKRADT